MHTTLLSVALTVLLLLVGPAHAQNQEQINYDQWESLATLVETTIDEPGSTEQELSRLRERTIEWREKLREGQSINSGRIATIKDQLSALGPVPAEGEPVDPDTKARREVLNEQLTTLQAPGLAAVEAFSRADALIRQIDEQLAALQAIELTQQSPRPINPTNWQIALGETVRLFEGVVTDTANLRSSEASPRELGDKLPKVLGYLALAVILLTFGRRWIDSLPSKLSARALDYSRAVVAFLASLGQIIVPMLGIYLAVSALLATGWFDDWTTPFLDALPVAGVILFGGRWLARQLFPNKAIAYATLDIPEKQRARARTSTNLLALVFAVQHVLSTAVLGLSGRPETSEAAMDRVPMDMANGAISVWHFVFIVTGAIILFRLGKVLRNIQRWSTGDVVALRNRVMMIAGGLSRIVALIAVALAAIGLVNLANWLFWSWVLTLATVGLLILFQDLIADIFNMAKRGQEGAREGLAPLLIGLFLILLSLPVFLVIWGASLTDLSEMWTQLRQGITLGGITLSPTVVLTFIIVFTIGYFMTRGLQGILRSSVLPKTKIDMGGQVAMVSGVGYVGITLAALLAVTSAGIDLSSLAIVAGALSVGIGFGLQNIVSNFVSGIILLIERPVSIGDWVDAGGQQGIVKRISVRSTLVETFDRTEVIVPNTDLISQPVTNWTRSSKNGRVIIPVGVAYGTDTKKVEQILMEIIEDQPTVMIDPPPAVLFRSLGADSLDFEIRAILSDVSGGLGVTSTVLHEIVRRFAEEGIEIPFAQRDLWLRNPSALANATAGAVVAAEKKSQPAKQDDKGSEPAEKRAAPDPALTFDGDMDGDGES